MKLRTWFFMAIGLIILLSVWFRSSARTQDTAPVFPATVNRDCAPWDGTAFTVSIPLEGSVIQISIYRPPDINYPMPFSFPDETMRRGHALLLLPVGTPEQLTGRVWFGRVDQQKPVEGRFNLTSEGGMHFEGAFAAEWENRAVYCG